MASEQTRLVVSNLPKDYDSDALRTHCRACPPSPPELTDVKVLKDKATGSTRRVAFIGCKDGPTANRVKGWLDGSWLAGVRAGGSKVRVEWATTPSHADRSKAGSSREPPTKRKRIEGSSEQPPQAAARDNDRFSHFLSIMKGTREAVPLESIPADAARPIAPAQNVPAEAAHNSLSKPPDLQAVGEERSRSPISNRAADVDDDDSDANWLSKRQKRTLGSAADDTPPSSDHSGAKTSFNSQSQSAADERSAMLDQGRLFLRNLPFSVTEAELRELFAGYKSLSKIHVLQRQGNPTGTAFAAFVNPAEAAAALAELDGSTFQGRLLHVMPAAARSGAAEDARTSDHSSVKSRQHDSRKTASDLGLNWSTLYMNPDTIATQYAQRLGISKADFLDPANSASAVRVAAAETNAIAETKTFFASNGIDLDALATGKARSRDTILVKNLPVDHHTDAVRSMFGAFGIVERCLVSPIGGFAIVQMADAHAAAKAWQALAYKQLGNSILYLERAPVGLFASSVSRTQGDAAPLATTSAAQPPKQESHSTETDSAESAASTVLYVKNVSFETTARRFESAFSHLRGFTFARLQMKPAPSEASRQLHMGYGFVGFDTRSAAEKAIKAMSTFLLDGHALELQFAKRGYDEREETSRAREHARGSKVVIKNLPFETTKKDIRDLVATYGEIKSLRLPKKMDARTRGFAFVDFASRAQAEKAVAALRHSHLLGRHLVLEWAKPEDSPSDQMGREPSSRNGPNKRKFTMEAD